MKRGTIKMLKKNDKVLIFGEEHLKGHCVSGMYVHIPSKEKYIDVFSYNSNTVIQMKTKYLKKVD